MQLPSWCVWYEKPAHQDIQDYARLLKTNGRSASLEKERNSMRQGSIPTELSLERILENRTCSPMSLYDFYMYLKYVEHSAENLEFFTWYHNYKRNYDRKKPYKTQDFSSSWLNLDPSAEDCPASTRYSEYPNPEAGMESLNRVSIILSPVAACVKDPRVIPVPVTNPFADTTTRARDELQAILDAFLVPGADKELNIPPAMRDEALHKLATSSDPAHLAPIAEHVYQLIKTCSHRNFIRLGVSNATYEQMCLATSTGVAYTLAGFLLVLLLMLSPGLGARSCWVAFGAWPLWMLGIALVLCGMRGNCFCLLLVLHRQPLPWERLGDAASQKARLLISDRKLRVDDVHLRSLQRQILIQSLSWGAMLATVGVLVFIFLPVWKETVRNSQG